MVRHPNFCIIMQPTSTVSKCKCSHNSHCYCINAAESISHNARSLSRNLPIQRNSTQLRIITSSQGRQGPGQGRQDQGEERVRRQVPGQTNLKKIPLSGRMFQPGPRVSMNGISLLSQIDLMWSEFRRDRGPRTAATPLERTFGQR